MTVKKRGMTVKKGITEREWQKRDMQVMSFSV